MKKGHLKSAAALRRVLVGAAAAVVALVATGADPGLEYRDRGNRNEGIRPLPVGGGDIELLSVRVDYQEPTQGMPDTARIRFFLRDADSVFVTVRELDYRHYYWLDELRPRTPWRAGFGNVFDWPTSDVLKKLAGLGLYDLGVVARIGTNQERLEERVAPVLLYHREAPQNVGAYLFAAKTNTPATLTCTIYAAGVDRPTFQQAHPRVRAGNVFTCRWDAASASEGAYRLVISGYSLDTNDALKRIVDFYHRPAVK